MLDLTVAWIKESIFFCNLTTFLYTKLYYD